MDKNIWIKIMTIGLLCLSLVACSSEQGSEQNVPTDKPKQEQAQPEQPPQEQPEPVQQPTETDQSKTETGDSETAIWKFTGLVDTHSAEFMVGNEPLVAEYPEEMRTDLEALEENQELEVHFKKDENGRFVLEKFEKVEK